MKYMVLTSMAMMVDAELEYQKLIPCISIGAKHKYQRGTNKFEEI
jgi:hypothetical protein